MIKQKPQNKWKQKIDPAFDKFVRMYAGFMTRLKVSRNEGRLDFPDDFIESIIEKTALQTANSEDLKSHTDIFSFLEKAGVLQRKDIELVFRAFESLENYKDILKICFELVEGLHEEESKQFYIKKFSSFKNDPAFKADINSVEKSSLDFYSFVLSLLFHYLFAKLFGDEKEINGDVGYFKKSKSIITFLNFIFFSFSQVANQKTLEELKKNFLKGDDRSLFKAVTIDKAFICTEEVSGRIIKAQLSGNSEFFKKLGKAITDNPLRRVGRHGATYSVLWLFWLMGLYKLSYSELYDFLVYCGLTPPEYPEAFEKFMKRHIKSVYTF